MTIRTTLEQRCRFYKRHLRGETYQEIRDDEGVSKESVRYWCRRQRDRGYIRTVYQRQRTGILSQFKPVVRYCVLRLRLEHPRWGPNRIRERLKKRPSLRGLRLPSEVSIGRYLHQWEWFRRQSKKKSKIEKLKQPTEIHQRWQIIKSVPLIHRTSGTLGCFIHILVCFPGVDRYQRQAQIT